VAKSSELLVGAPHAAQNLALAEFSLPQDEHVAMSFPFQSTLSAMKVWNETTLFKTSSQGSNLHFKGERLARGGG
jgi:hypothetical protein